MFESHHEMTRPFCQTCSHLIPSFFIARKIHLNIEELFPFMSSYSVRYSFPKLPTVPLDLSFCSAQCSKTLEIWGGKWFSCSQLEDCYRKKTKNNLLSSVPDHPTRRRKPKFSLKMVYNNEKYLRISFMDCLLFHWVNLAYLFQISMTEMHQVGKQQHARFIDSFMHWSTLSSLGERKDLSSPQKGISNILKLC